MPIFFTKKSCNRGGGTTPPQMPLTVNRKKVVRVDIQIFVFRAIHSTSKSVKIAKMAILALFVNKLYEKQDI